MRRAYDVAAVRAAEERALAATEPGELMQRAARGLSTACVGLLRGRRGAVYGSSVVLLVGAGNNGGDTLYAGAFLARRGCRVVAVALAEQVHPDGAAALRAEGGRIIEVLDEAGVLEAVRLLPDADLVLDGIVGIGGKGALREPAATLVRAVGTGQALRVAVDIPSGVDPDTGIVEDPERVFSADLTVTFGCLKTGLLAAPGRDHAGAVEVVDIGLTKYLSLTPHVRAVQARNVSRYLPPPGPSDHKYSRGVVGVLAGSAKFPGAACLTVGGARRSGVGMVRYLDREDGVAGRVIDVYPDVVRQTEDPGADPRVLAWAVGPGMGTSKSDERALLRVLEADVPAVIDADALWLLAERSEVQRHLAARTERGTLTVLTPHSGEFSRLGFTIGAGGRIEAAREAARQLGCLILLKGSGTVVAGPTGAVYVDPLGVHDLATAGSGDVLTGVVAGLLAHRSAAATSTDTARAVAAAAYIHGMAAVVAAEGDRPVVATDLIDSLPEAIARLRGR